MKQIGLASKTFSQLEKQDYLFYINPKTQKIEQLLVKSVTPWEQKKNYVVITYYKSEAGFKLLTDTDLLDTAKIIVDGRGTHMLVMTNPPTVYYTSKGALEKWMQGR